MIYVVRTCKILYNSETIGLLYSLDMKGERKTGLRITSRHLT